MLAIDQQETSDNFMNKEDANTDWKALFEDEKTGLITLVTMAKSAKSVIKCVHTIIDMLFQRESDVKFKKALKGRVNIMGPDAEAGTIERSNKVKTESIAILRDIMENRIENALAEIKSQESKSKKIERRQDDSHKASDESEGQGSSTTQQIENMIINVFCDRIKERADALSAQKEDTDGPELPFMCISSDLI